VDSMSTLHGVHRHFLKYSGLHGLYSMDCSWTLHRIHGLSVDSMRAASLTYLMKKKVNHIYKSMCSEQESNSGPFGHHKTTHQPTELTGHVSNGLFRKYIMPTPRVGNELPQSQSSTLNPQPSHHHQQQQQQQQQQQRVLPPQHPGKYQPPPTITTPLTTITTT
jgi:hypothetical protein